MAHALSDFLSLTVERLFKVRDNNQFPGPHGMQPIFIVVSDVPKMSNIVADKLDANSFRFVCTSVQCLTSSPTSTDSK